ncbi:MAG TPA: MFS transporter [Methylomirabilota bacterium]|nr:MFS transporter [Methylomirabilota bacterium]
MSAERESLLEARLAVAFAVMLFVSGITNTFPVFFPPLLAEFGGSRAGTALAVTLIWVAGAALSPVAGHLVDRTSPRALVAAGITATALGLGLGAVAPTLRVFTLAFGLGVGIGIGCTGMVTQAAVINARYRRRRGLATGIVFAGSMAGWAMAWPAQQAITAVGWRATLGVYVAVLILLLPLAWRFYPARLTSDVAAPAAGGALGDVVRTVPFWALATLFSLAPFIGNLATMQHAVYFASLGYPAWEASLMLMLGGVLGAVGRAMAGLVADRAGPVVTGFLSYALTLTGVVCLLGLELAPVRALAYGYVLFLFLPMGTRATVVSQLVPHLAPPSKFGSVFGWLALGNSLGAGLGPFVSGALYDATGSYLVIYVSALGLVAVAITALALFVQTTRAAVY